MTIELSDVARLSPIGHEHVKAYGKYSLQLSESIQQGAFHPLHELDETESLEGDQEVSYQPRLQKSTSGLSVHFRSTVPQRPCRRIIPQGAGRETNKGDSFHLCDIVLRRLPGREYPNPSRPRSPLHSWVTDEWSRFYLASNAAHRPPCHDNASLAPPAFRRFPPRLRMLAALLANWGGCSSTVES